MAHCDAAGVNGSNRILLHGALAAADDAEWMSGKSRARLALVLTEASSWMSDKCSWDAVNGDLSRGLDLHNDTPTNGTEGDLRIL